MKKIVLFLFLPILFFSCNKENKTEAVDVASGKKEYIYSPDISANENQLVIVRFSSGKKIGKWPNQQCIGKQRKPCWRWLPKDQITINSYELYEDYAFLSYEGAILSYHQPRYNFFTEHEMYQYTQIFSTGILNIPEDILVSDAFILDEFELSSSFIIKAGEYPYEYADSDYIIVPLDMGMQSVETIERAYCMIELANEINTYSSAPWFCFVNDEGYIEATDLPLGVFDFDENGKPMMLNKENEKVMIAAHRGGADTNPENTLLAYRAAVNEYKVDILESDLYLTKDGYLVYNHDSYIDETCNVNGDISKDEMKELIKDKSKRHYIEDYTLEELQKLNFGYYFTDKEGNRPYKDLTHEEVVQNHISDMTIEEQKIAKKFNIPEILGVKLAASGSNSLVFNASSNAKLFIVFNISNHIYTSAVSAAFKFGINKEVGKFDSGANSDNTSSQTQYVRIVVQTGKFSRKIS